MYVHLTLLNSVCCEYIGPICQKKRKKYQILCNILKHLIIFSKFAANLLNLEKNRKKKLQWKKTIFQKQLILKISIYFEGDGYSIVKDSSADLGINLKIVQNSPTDKAVCTKISKKNILHICQYFYISERK